MNRILVLVVLLIVAPVSLAKEATSMAADPLMEERVNEIASELRCLVCQNQTIADSHAELAIDLKNQVREMVGEGRSDKEITDYMVKRYGDFVLYRPPVNNATVLLWVGPFLFLVLGLLMLAITLRKRNTLLQDDAPMSAEEHQRLQSVLAEEDKNQGGEQKS